MKSLIFVLDPVYFNNLIIKRKSNYHVMVEKIVFKQSLKAHDEVQQNLEYWLSKDPAERISAVELLRRQQDGNSTRLQRIIRKKDLAGLEALGEI